jgi:predicted RNA-binding Zn ribbon-like protein
VTPYRYVGGDPSIDFVNTVDWVDNGLDRFTSYDRVVEWAEGTEGTPVISAETAAGLRSLAEREPAAARHALDDAVELRALLERLFFSLSHGASAQAEIDALNGRWMRRALGHIAIVRGRDGTLALDWPDAQHNLESPLWAVSRRAALLLTSNDASRIKRCGGDDCGWYFVDRSRNGLRRWCQMETCGTRMKSRRRAERSVTRRPITPPQTPFTVP